MIKLFSYGLYHWIVQRVSSIIISIYILFLFTYFFINVNLTYQDWHNLFYNKWMRICNIITLFSIILHICIGMWTISTDYVNLIKVGKYASIIRGLVQLMLVFIILLILLWGLYIILLE